MTTIAYLEDGSILDRSKTSIGTMNTSELAGSEKIPKGRTTWRGKPVFASMIDQYSVVTLDGHIRSFYFDDANQMINIEVSSKEQENSIVKPTYYKVRKNAYDFISMVKDGLLSHETTASSSSLKFTALKYVIRGGHKKGNDLDYLKAKEYIERNGLSMQKGTDFNVNEFLDKYIERGLLSQEDNDYELIFLKRRVIQNILHLGHSSKKVAEQEYELILNYLERLHRGII